MRWLSVFAVIVSTSLTWPAVLPESDKIVEKYENAKTDVNDLDTKSREVMSALYEINMRMKGVSKRRDDLNNQLLKAESQVKDLSRETIAIEDRLKTQKYHLSRRLRAIYKLGDEGVARIIFSSADSAELDQNLKYLKIISDRDFNLIKSFAADLNKLETKKTAMKKEVIRLLKIKDDLKKHELILSQDQGSKSNLLSKLGVDRQKAIQRISSLREFAKEINIQDMLNLSFFEQKGVLKAPVDGLVSIPYGLVENEKFHYQLGHKGWSYDVSFGSDISSIFNGRVAFLGEVEGFGKTIVVDHGDHYYSVYTNANRLNVRQGQSIDKGQVIAKSQDHFYFEIRHFSDAIDPENWIK